MYDGIQSALRKLWHGSHSIINSCNHLGITKSTGFSTRWRRQWVNSCCICFRLRQLSSSSKNLAFGTFWRTVKLCNLFYCFFSNNAKSAARVPGTTDDVHCYWHCSLWSFFCIKKESLEVARPVRGAWDIVTHKRSFLRSLRSHIRQYSNSLDCTDTYLCKKFALQRGDNKREFWKDSRSLILSANFGWVWVVFDLRWSFFRTAS